MSARSARFTVHPRTASIDPSPEAGDGQAGPVSGLIAALWLRLPKTHGVSVTAATCVDAIYRCGGSNRIVKKPDALFSRFTRRRVETRVEHLAWGESLFHFQINSRLGATTQTVRMHGKEE